jgi:hypothetical protein
METVVENSEKSHGKRGRYKNTIPSPKTLQILCLRKLGWTVEQVAQTCNVSERTVYARCSDMKDYFADLPTIQAAKDAIQCLIPKAVRVYEKSLEDTTKLGLVSVLAADIATKVLISSKVIADRKVIEDEREQSTGKLVDEAERILAGVANPSAGRSQAQSDTGDTPGA